MMAYLCHSVISVSNNKTIHLLETKGFCLQKKLDNILLVTIYQFTIAA